MRVLTRRGFKKPKVVKFYSHELFTTLIVEHFIESGSMRLFHTGLCIVKNLLRDEQSREVTTQMIIEYEECCVN